MADGTSIVVLGIGARTPAGMTAAASAAAVRAGISVAANHPYMVDRFGYPMKVCRDAFIAAETTGPSRAVELAVAPALEALSNLQPRARPDTVSLVLASAEDRPGQTADFSSKVFAGLLSRLGNAVRLGRGGFMAGGHAGGVAALLHARDALARGQVRLCLVGGVDTYLEPETLEWLDQTEQLHSEGNIYGFCPGEAAGFCLLSTLDTAQELGLPPLLELVAVATAREENRINTETVCLGEGLGAAFRSVVAQADKETAPIDRIVCDMNGQRYRANEYGFAILRTPRRFRDAADFETPADCWGDVGAASGALFISLLTQGPAQARGRPLSLIWASSEGGSRAAALLRQAQRTY